MWETVKTRKHGIHKVFPGWFDAKSESVDTSTDAPGVLEFMICGTVVYTSKQKMGEDGKEEKMDWAARAELIRTGNTSDDDDDAGGDYGSASLSSENGNTTGFVFKKYRVYLSPSVE